MFNYCLKDRISDHNPIMIDLMLTGPATRNDLKIPPQSSLQRLHLGLAIFVIRR